jgi:hypothetical protein
MGAKDGVVAATVSFAICYLRFLITPALTPLPRSHPSYSLTRVVCLR